MLILEDLLLLLKRDIFTALYKPTPFPALSSPHPSQTSPHRKNHVHVHVSNHPLTRCRIIGFKVDAQLLSLSQYAAFILATRHQAGGLCFVTKIHYGATFLPIIPSFYKKKSNVLRTYPSIGSACTSSPPAFLGVFLNACLSMKMSSFAG